MSTKTLEEITKTLRDLDYTMLSTKKEDGAIASRPMSNNKDIAYSGDSFFFTNDGGAMVKEIEADAHVTLNYVGAKGLLGSPPLFVTVEGEAVVIRDRSELAGHWRESMKRWFEQGIDTPGICLLKVHAKRIAYWNGDDHGEVTLPWSTRTMLAESKTMLGAGTARSDI